MKLAKNLKLPSDVVTWTMACIAMKGAGKTYTAGKLVELMLEAGAQVIVLDPIGTWWGRRRIRARRRREGSGRFLRGLIHAPFAPRAGTRRTYGALGPNRWPASAMAQFLWEGRFSSLVKV